MAGTSLLQSLHACTAAATQSADIWWDLTAATTSTFPTTASHVHDRRLGARDGGCGSCGPIHHGGGGQGSDVPCLVEPLHLCWAWQAGNPLLMVAGSSPSSSSPASLGLSWLVLLF